MTPETSIYEFAKQGLERFPEKAALWFYGRLVSFRELFCRVNHMAQWLSSRGVRKGTVVTIHLPNCPQLVTVIYAVAKIGGICNMVHAQTPPQGVQEIMAFAQSDLLFTHLTECALIAENTVVVSVLPGKPQVTEASCRPLLDLTDAFLQEAPESEDIPSQKRLAEECVVYLHSSGSTGKPKTIMLSHKALNHCVDNTADFFEDDASSYVSLGVLPAFHGFGLAMDVHRNLRFGSTLVQMLRWDTDLAVQLIKKLKVSLMVGVPTMYYALLNHPEFCGEGIAHMKKCYVGGDNVKPELITAFDNRIDGKHHMFVGYGLTEATTTDCVNTYRHYKAGSSGYPTRGTTVAVIDAKGAVSYKGEGELIISSATLMIGYLRDVEATEKTIFFADGKRWTRTGDLVTIDDDGFVFFQDRVKNIIIHNGYNIYPAQVEEIVRMVPGVTDACVIGTDVPELHTQNVCAIVVPMAEGEQESLAEKIRAKCLEMLPRYSVPKKILFTSELPLNAMGKIDRVKLGEIYGK